MNLYLQKSQPSILLSSFGMLISAYPMKNTKSLLEQVNLTKWQSTFSHSTFSKGIFVTHLIWSCYHSPLLKLKFSSRGLMLYHLRKFRAMWQYWKDFKNTISSNVSYHITIWHHNPEDLDSNLSKHDKGIQASVKSQKKNGCQRLVTILLLFTGSVQPLYYCKLSTCCNMIISGVKIIPMLLCHEKSFNHVGVTSVSWM